MQPNLSQYLSQWKMKSSARRELSTEDSSYNGKYHLDKLTGILNSNCIREILDTKPESSGLDITVFSLDVDNLKKINDIPEEGHWLGDDLLRRVGMVLSTTFRKGDSLIVQLNSDPNNYDKLVARSGGDEFVAILLSAPDQTQEALKRITQDLLGNIEACNNSEENKDKPEVSLSFGHSKYEPENDNTLYDTYRRADKAMYKQKNDKKCPPSVSKKSGVFAFQIN